MSFDLFQSAKSRSQRIIIIDKIIIPLIRSAVSYGYSILTTLHRGTSISRYAKNGVLVMEVGRTIIFDSLFDVTALDDDRRR